MLGRLDDLWNTPIKNPIQNMYMRGMKSPLTGIHSTFTEAQKDFKNAMKMPDIFATGPLRRANK